MTSGSPRRSELFASARPCSQAWCESGIMYANVGPEFYVSLHGSKHPTVKVLVREVEPGEASPYYAWWESSDACFRYVWPSRGQVEACFGDADVVARAETKGRGRLLNVVVEIRGTGA